MHSLPTLPRRTWLERLSLGLAVAIAALGAVTLFAWWMQWSVVLQPPLPIGLTAPMRANTAVAVLALGVVLLMLEFGHRRFAVLALVPALVGALTLTEHFWHLDLRIDELLASDPLLIGTDMGGRMGPMVAISLLLAGVTMAWRATDRKPHARLFAEAVVGSLLASAGFSTLLGYVATLPAVYNWGTRFATGPVTGISLLALGAALLLLAWRESMKKDGEPPAWSPMPAIVGCLTLTVILSVGLRDRESSYVRQRTEATSKGLATEIQVTLNQQTINIERLARARAELLLKGDALIGWEADAKKQYEETSVDGCAMIAFLDAEGRNRWVYPERGNELALDFNHKTVERRAAALEASGSAPYNSIISGSVPITAPGAFRPLLGAVIYAPVIRSGELIGYVAAEFPYERLFAAICSHRQQLDNEYYVQISLLGEVVYQSANGNVARSDELAQVRSYNIFDRTLRVTLTPTKAVLGKDRQFLPELALAAGFGMTVLLGLSVHLARSARAGQHAAELSNKRLFAENEERRRIEARLKVSDERLRLALDSTQIGIFEWSVGAGHVYYSPGLWAMLGYDHTRMPSTVEVWQSLIHPDDLALYRRRTESQLNGVASFIEPEYRVRARSGEWRWVYTRSKSVATDPGGRPTRIVGTVQDITARREAELALRESQAETRKLSLVASKTDNPVLIGSPDGRIEWANEAFSRMMEYDLDEVVGRTPAHFMVGADSNADTIARIRAALANGQGISTDVVNYSKSGRKYHLHLEVQPVHGPTGEVQNYIAVGTDITTRVDTEQQLRRAKSDADDASRAKSEFLASMSHEIRTPMNGVIGMTSLLMETTLTMEQRDFVNTIRSSGEALLTIINDILDFSKIESGKMELERAPFELALCLEDALDIFALGASAKKIELGYHIANDVPTWFMGDVTRLRQVIVNLVNNAVKFTPGGSISVEIRRVTREPTPLGFEDGLPSDPARLLLEFTVRDTGIGIPADRIDRLFKAFSQVDSSTTRKYGGTGLGLAICQRLTQLMGGDIRVESKAGEGSAFIFTIRAVPASGASDSGLPILPAALREGIALCVEDHPVTQARLRTFFEKAGAECAIVPDPAAAKAAVARLPRPPALLVVSGGELEDPSPLEILAGIRCPRLILYPFGQTAPSAPADLLPFASITKPIRTASLLHAINSVFSHGASSLAAAAKAADRPVGDEIPLEVLLAEDNAVNQKVALRFLERLGYRAEAVANGREAIAALENRRYDLILMDLQMPEMDGFEATRQIRTRLGLERQPKIVALTANAMQGDRDLCVAAGMDDYISKPVKMHEIAAVIRKHFGKPAVIPISQQWIG